ncbi:PUS7 [Candida jiufengensis]|uniref:PUS7 n=1 Tax=Candida jiufengensis TaxID=497108 RepID=UPI00222525BE|nr:PUS7 [Candida jiufengensis]KAI5952297.1 PUS7 [Candida jiufengensis]
MTQQLKRTTSAEDEISNSIIKKFKSEPTQTTTTPASFGISEEDVGILKFINNSTTGFSGLLKTLHCDFQVNEISPNNQVVHLIDEGIDVGKTNREKKIEAAKERKGKSEEEPPKELKEEENKSNYELSSENKEQLLTFITPEELTEIEQLFTTGNNMETKTSFDDKEKRTKLHQLFRESFQNKLETVTSPTNTFKIAIAKNKGGNQRRNNNNNNGQESMHHVDENGVINYGAGQFKPFLHFTVYKQNRDTMDVSNNIAKMLRIPPKTINYAGTKDRRGVTCQRFSINKGKVLRINALNKMKNSNFKLGSFKYEDKPLKLGDLNGNQFTITLRDVKLANNETDTNIKAVISQCFNSFNQHGFINYFGMQRFGSFSVPTHELGKAILQENWEKAVELLLSEQELCSPGTVEMRKIWKDTKNAKEALASLPRHFVAENHILKVLTSEPQDENKNFKPHSYLKALLSIPKNLRMMYVHSYQSYIWNLVASKRIELFGYEIQEGDLVLAGEESTKLKEDDEFEEDVANFEPIPVKTVTKEDITTKKYSIFDVILPSPGFKITYPENEQIQKVYIDTMSFDNLDPFRLMRKNKEFSLTGAYRNLISIPKDLSYDIVEYQNDQSPLVRTDLEILEILKSKGIKTTPDSEINIENFGKEAIDSRVIKQELKEGEEIKLAVILKMKLGVSSYATMALREFMRIDTSRYAHMK